MRVRLRTRYASSTAQYAPGAVVNFPAAEAEALVEGGFAVALDDALDDDAGPARRETAEGRGGRRNRTPPRER